MNLAYDKKIETVKYFTNLGYDSEDIKLVCKKGVFAYDWNNTYEKLNYNKIY